MLNGLLVRDEDGRNVRSLMLLKLWLIGYCATVVTYATRLHTHIHSSIMTELLSCIAVRIKLSDESWMGSHDIHSFGLIVLAFCIPF